MYILFNGRLEQGFLDHYRAPDEYRLKVLAIRNLEELSGLYVVRPRSLRLVWNYLWRIGWRATLRKIFSRLGESRRNQKFASCGIGLVLEAPPGAAYAPGALVAFFAPLHPAALERVVLPPDFLTASPVAEPGEEDELHWLPLGEASGERWWKTAAGWSPYSGIKAGQAADAKMRERLAQEVKMTAWERARTLKGKPSGVAERRTSAERPAGRSAILFGYGNYAKTIVLPNVRPHLTLAGVHEIDPAQMPPRPAGPSGWDSSPSFRAGERADAALIAGYHHTHAALAAEAMERGMYAVAEKPVATTPAELDLLLRAAGKHPGKFFAGFHKRYSEFNELLRSDLGLSEDAPLNYHTIVYEVPQPANYWYRWQVSRGPILANGCHWIDHFLYLNHFSAPVRKEVFAVPDGSVQVSMTLKNGAFFTMLLTDRGSPWIGVEDHVEVRAGDATARIVNDAWYEAARGLELVRRLRRNKMENYRRAYRAIAKKIAAGEDGDSLESIKVSAQAVLDLEKLYSERL